MGVSYVIKLVTAASVTSLWNESNYVDEINSTSLVGILKDCSMAEIPLQVVPDDKKRLPLSSPLL